MAQDRVQGISGFAVAAVFAGGILAWSAVKGYRLSQVARDVISGKDPAKDPANTSWQGLKVSPAGLIASSLSSIPILGQFTAFTGGGSGNVQSSGGSVAPGTNAQNKALGQRMAAAVGWTGAEWTALNNLVMSESGWNSTILNTQGSGAAGIAQNIRGFGPGYQRGNAAQQIAWMISYIKTRYGDPINAWNFHMANNWY